MSTAWPPGYSPSFENCNEVNALCPVEASTYGDYFSLGGSLFYCIFFFLLLVYTTFVGIKGRTWSFTIFLFIGLAFEVMGYGARVSMSPIGTVWTYAGFVIQLLFLILAPTLIAAAISVTFKWIVIYLGVQYSVMRASWYPWVFVGTDFFSIVIQAVGGAISATATGGSTFNSSLLDVGSGLLTAGVAFQAANMIFCGGLMVIYWWRYRKDAAGRAERSQAEKEAKRGSDGSGTAMGTVPVSEGSEASEQGVVRDQSGSDVNVSPESTEEPTKKTPQYNMGPPPKAGDLKKFIWALLIAYIAVLIRCIYRIPEMSAGWGSDIMQDEPSFLVLDGGMVAIASLILAIFHPTFYFPILTKPKKNKNKTKVIESSEKA